MLEFCVRDVISVLCYAFFDEKKKKIKLSLCH